MNYYYDPYHYSVYYSIPRQGPAMLWTPTEATQNLAQYRGQYIRTAITGFGVVYAQLTDYNPATGQVDLNVYFTPGRPPQFMRVNRVDLTGIVPLGFQPPPEILNQPVTPTMPTTPAIPTTPTIPTIPTIPTTPTTPVKPPFCMWNPWHPLCR